MHSIITHTSEDLIVKVFRSRIEIHHLHWTLYILTVLHYCIAISWLWKKETKKNKKAPGQTDSEVVKSRLTMGGPTDLQVYSASHEKKNISKLHILYSIFCQSPCVTYSSANKAYLLTQYLTTNGCLSTCADLGWVAKQWIETFINLHANSISTKLSASHRKLTQAHESSTLHLLASPVSLRASNIDSIG